MNLSSERHANVKIGIWISSGFRASLNCAFAFTPTVFNSQAVNISHGAEQPAFLATDLFNAKRPALSRIRRKRSLAEISRDLAWINSNIGEALDISNRMEVGDFTSNEIAPFSRQASEFLAVSRKKLAEIETELKRRSDVSL